tara:strand:- start:451 stop:747 length:297 start_codon:yes stop_codon:yes gene_type:complete
MKNFYKFLKSLLFISLWLILSDFLIEKYWNIIHLEYVDYNLQIIFFKEYWFDIEKFLLGFDIGNLLEKWLIFLSYEIPKESFKYFPIYFVLKSFWIKN